MNELIHLVRSFGVARLGAVIGVSAGVAIALALIIARIETPSLNVLYADISYGEAQPVLDRLDQDGVRYKLRENGGRVSILAPRDRISQLRLSLAADGVVANATVGYEIFDDNKALGATSFQQNINRLRALEGELERTLTTINGVRSARVHLVLPERELFAKERQTATASIVIDAPAGLDARTVRAIVNLTASAVPALNPSHVTVLDSKGQLLASGADSDGENAVSASIEEKKIAAQARLRREVEDMIGRIVGADNVRVEVAADMDFSRVTESAQIVDPDSQTVLSSTTVEETSNSADPTRAQGVSVANALPGAQAPSQNGAASTSATQRTEETTNYEITKTMRNAVREQGLVIKRLSVAVALNGASQTGPDGALTYTPHTAEELARIETLVKSAIGYSEARGDQVSVVDIRFNPIEAPVAATPAAAASSPLLEREDVMRLAELGALALIALALAYFVLRPLMTPNPANAAPYPTAYQSRVAAPAAAAAITQQPPSEFEQRIDLAQVDGQVKASSINKVSEIVKAHTDESANILRGWMREAS